MSLVSLPFTFVNGTPADASQVNSDLSAITAVINGNIDNTNMGSAGIFASQIIPGSLGQATFGGAQTYKFPVNLQAVGSISAGSGTQAALSSGDLGASRSASTGSISIGGSTSSATIDFGVTTAGITTSSAPFTSLSEVRSRRTGATGTSYVPPCYTPGGLACGGQMHIVTGTATFSASQTVVVSLTGDAQFSSGSSYVVFVMPFTASIWAEYNITAATGTGFNINSNPAITATVNWMAIGT